MAKRSQIFFIFFIFFWPIYYAKITPDYNTSEKYLVVDGFVPEHPVHAKYLVSIADLRKFSLEDPSTFGHGHICGGSIIGIRTILTAAHCIYKEKPKNFVVIAGTPVRTKKVPTTLIYRVKNMTAHDGYKPVPIGTSYDIGIIMLHGKIVEDYKTVQRIYIAPESYALPGLLCLLIGWGRFHVQSKLSESLQYLVLRISDQEKCDRYLVKPMENTFCAVDPTKKRGAACYGDSGGPLICRDRLAGIAALMHISDEPTPTHFTNVNKYIEWIRERTTDPLHLVSARSLAIRGIENMMVLKISVVIHFFMFFI